jgi:hypothetical protein
MSSHRSRKLVTAAVLCASVTTGLSLSAKEQTYTMADLTALEARGSYEEALSHIEDVPPSARTTEWDRVLVSAAKGTISLLSTASANYDAFWVTERLVQRYPVLRGTPAFMAKRGEVGKLAIDRCFREAYGGQGCLDQARDFIAVAPDDRDLDVAIGKIVRLNQNHYAAVPFFRAAVTGVAASKWCTDPDLKLAVMAGIGLPPDYDLAKQSCAVALTCYDALRSDIRAAMLSGPTDTKANATYVVKTKGGGA